MRISTNTFFDTGASSIGRQQADLLQLQQQISAGRRMLVPSDDPISAVRALEFAQADAVNVQHGTNAQAASGKLSVTEGVLARAVNLLQTVRETAVAAGNGAYTTSDHITLAHDLRAMRDELLGLANSTDGEGNFLFSGYQTDVQPFAASAAGVQYSGDDGERLVQISPNRFVEVSESGADVFMRVRRGNGEFVVSAAPANTGNAIYGPGTVADPALATGDRYQIVFSVTASTPPVTTYDVLDITAGTTVQSARPYIAGGKIAFDGIQFEVAGVPANGDRIDIDPSTEQDVFRTISDLADALQGFTPTDAGRARFANAVTDALSNLDQALEQAGSRRSLVGTRMREVETTQGISEDLSIQYKQLLSQLQDLDYARAISDLMRQKTNLEAAQQSFVRTANLSIFNYL
jgi:flagellar hook-associated protein 3 FlgL